MLYDKQFLLNLDQCKNKVIYAKITALTLQEYPIETIEGRVTQGSINLDGASAVRRTCSLTMVAQDFNYSNFLWGLNTKFKLEIGVENTIDTRYDDIIWFKQGIYFISSFNTARSTNNFTITIQGKDKMSMLNGELGGSINSSVDFGTIEEEDQYGNWVIRKLPIKEIIRNMVHQYGGEPLHNIIINDVPDIGYELLEYRYDIPMYLYKLDGENIYANATLDGSIICNVYHEDGSLSKQNITFDQLQAEDLEMLVDPLMGQSKAKIKISGDTNYYTVAKVEYGQTAGYKETPLTYAGDLIANIGETIVSVLDKIKNMLGEFEYFYDLDGRFVFQQKASFIDTIYGQSGNNTNDNQDRSEWVDSSYVNSGVAQYIFHGGELITTFNNNPNIAGVRNDYSIWGQRTTISGAQVPIHLRYAIDIKPTEYTSICVDFGEYKVDKDNNIIINEDTQQPEMLKKGTDYEVICNYNKKYGTALRGQDSQTYKAENSDWREVIYQMAIDYYKYNHLEDFELRVAEKNPALYPYGITGYESYYTDIQGFWRQLYDPDLEQKYDSAIEDEKKLSQECDKLSAYVAAKKSPQIISSLSEFNVLKLNYDTIYQLNGEVYNPVNEYQNPGEYFVDCKDSDLEFLQQEYTYQQTLLEEQQLKVASLKETINLDYYYPIVIDAKGNKTSLINYDSKKLYWNRNVWEHPEALNFWFDFLDTEGQLSQFNVKVIGCRPKAVNDTNIKSIYFRETPSILYLEEDEQIPSDEEHQNKKYIQAPGIWSMFSISAQGKSAKTKLDELLYQHGYCAESATINCIPIYYLQPNIRIHIVDKETHLDGDYIISKLTIPLAYNGTMSLTATKAAETYLY